MSIRIRAPRSDVRDGIVTVASRIGLPDGDFDLFFRGPADAIDAVGADAFLIACLPTAMRLHLPIQVEGAVSSTLLAGLPVVQEIMSSWRPALAMVEVHAAGTHAAGTHATAPPRRERATDDGCAVFFSGGVDSFHSVHCHLADISALVLVHGFDMPLSNLALRARVSESLARTADSLGRRLVQVETNMRELTDRHAEWLYEQCGAALAAVAVLLSPVTARTVIPSSSTYALLYPYATHPLIDPHFGTEYMRLVHDGAAFDRVRKVADLATMPAAMDTLRVCWRNPGGSYNCGRCEKCLRTVAALVACGALTRCRTFDEGARERLRTLQIESTIAFNFVAENAEALRRSGRDAEVLTWLEDAMTRYRREQFIQQLRAQPLSEWAGIGAMLTRKVVGRVRRLVTATPAP